MPTKVILLMGAPTTQSLQWDEDQLLDTPIPPFHSPDSHHQETLPFPEEPVKWRVLQEQPASEQQNQDTQLGPNRVTMFLTTEGLEGLSDTAGEDSVLSQFYDHSFAVHETSEVSVPVSFSESPSLQESGSWADSSTMTTSAISSSKQEGTGSSLLSVQGKVSDLQEIPSAGYLRSIVPQTVTVNLVVGIIRTQPPRRVVTRRWKRELDIVEMVVADETRAGFGVTFWLPPTPERASGDSDSNNEGLGRSLAGLRPRDIVLLRMVGLSSFRERVYGQSLRKGITQVDLLHRQRVDATDAGGIYGLRQLNARHDGEPDPVVVKVRRVREWIRRFVGAGPERAGGNGAGGMRGLKRGPTLPPDTQELV